MNAVVVSVLEDFCQSLKRSKAIGEELRREIRDKREFGAR